MGSKKPSSNDDVNLSALLQRHVSPPPCTLPPASEPRAAFSLPSNLAATPSTPKPRVRGHRTNRRTHLPDATAAHSRQEFFCYCNLLDRDGVRVRRGSRWASTIRHWRHRVAPSFSLNVSIPIRRTRRPQNPELTGLPFRSHPNKSPRSR